MKPNLNELYNMNKNKNLCIRIDEATKDKLKLEAKSQGRSLSNHVKNILTTKQ
jgi:predicted HicB family RNase H-like nuclease